MWTIEAAKNSQCFSRIIVSSEDSVILKMARDSNVDAFDRPSRLSYDPAGCIHVAQAVLELTEADPRKYVYDGIAILMPTCPFRNAQDIRSACRAASNLNVGSLISVSEFSHTPLNGLFADGTNHLTPILPEYFGGKSQEIPSAYRPNGGIFLMSKDQLKQAADLYPAPLRAYIMPRDRSVDIDSRSDLELAEYMLSQKNFQK
jgi:CMP-N-acetylneuraminic acid synthetase